MQESMGQIIKRLRRERDWTQEELAEQLNLSAQAISKWENETSMPDISQVVPLASVFGVSTDVLFGVFGAGNEEEIGRILQEVGAARVEPETKESVSKQYAILQEGLKRYPNNSKLLINCLECGMTLAYPENGEFYDAENGRAIYKECIRMAALVISYGRNATDVLRAHMILVLLHSAYGDGETAREHAVQFPGRGDMTVFAMQAFIAHNEGSASEIAEWELNFLCHLEAILDTMTNLGLAYRKNERYDDALQIFLTAVKVIDLLFDGEETPPALHYRNDGYDLYEVIAETYLECGRQEEAFFWLEKLIRYDIEVREKFRQGARLRSPLQRDLPAGHFYRHFPWDLDNRRRLLDKLNLPAFDSIREEPRFRALLARIG